MVDLDEDDINEIVNENKGSGVVVQFFSWVVFILTWYIILAGLFAITTFITQYLLGVYIW